MFRKQILFKKKRAVKGVKNFLKVLSLVCHKKLGVLS